MSWKVESVMTRDVVAVRPETPYKELAELVAGRGLSAIPIVDVVGTTGKLVGIVSEADLLEKEELLAAPPTRRSLLRSGRDRKAGATTAAGLMTTQVVTVSPEATLAEAARIMHRKHVKRLPVVDAEGHLVGIVSRSDLIKAYIRSDESIRDEVVDEVVRRSMMIDPETVTVTVAEGVVTLLGALETESDARILVRLVRSVEGVVDVVDQTTFLVSDQEAKVQDEPLSLHYSARERESSDSTVVRSTNP